MQKVARMHLRIPNFYPPKIILHLCCNDPQGQRDALRRNVPATKLIMPPTLKFRDNPEGQCWTRHIYSP